MCILHSSTPRATVWTSKSQGPAIGGRVTGSVPSGTAASFAGERHSSPPIVVVSRTLSRGYDTLAETGGGRTAIRPPQQAAVPSGLGVRDAGGNVGATVA